MKRMSCAFFGDIVNGLRCSTADANGHCLIPTPDAYLRMPAPRTALFPSNEKIFPARHRFRRTSAAGRRALLGERSGVGVR